MLNCERKGVWVVTTFGSLCYVNGWDIHCVIHGSVVMKCYGRVRVGRMLGCTYTNCIPEDIALEDMDVHAH